MQKIAYCTIDISPVIEKSIVCVSYPHLQSNTGRVLCKIMLSSKSGINGSCWDEYVYVNLDELNKQKFVEVFDPITELTHLINTNNIVEITYVHGYRVGYKHENTNFVDKRRADYYFAELDVDFKLLQDRNEFKGYTSVNFKVTPIITITD